MIALTSLFHANSNKTNNIQSDHQHDGGHKSVVFIIESSSSFQKRYYWLVWVSWGRFWLHKLELVFGSMLEVKLSSLLKRPDYHSKIFALVQMVRIRFIGIVSRNCSIIKDNRNTIGFNKRFGGGCSLWTKIWHHRLSSSVAYNSSS